MQAHSIPLVERVVALCCRWPLAVAAGILALAVVAGLYTGSHFAMNSDSGKLISDQIGWRQREIRFDRLFPQQSNLILVVIDGKTPELAEAAAAKLSARLNQDRTLFPDVRRPDGGAFFDHNGLLFLSVKEVQATTQQLFKAQPFLGALAADPSLRGVMDSLSAALLGVTQGQAKLADLDVPMRRFAQVFSAATHGKTDYLSWRSLITGGKPRPEELRRFIEILPRLDFAALEPGAHASETIRADARDLGLTLEQGVRIRLTGDVPLSDEEFGTLTDRAALMAAAMMTGVLATLWLALRSFKIILAILVTLFAGLAITMGLGLVFVGVFNIISIAFIALFVGLGVDFGIQFSVRYRAERFQYPKLEDALRHTGRSVGLPLALAAAATAAGFLSFLPTSYTGVAELGLMAGLGMIVAFLSSITLLPALLMLLRPEGEAREIGFKALAPVDDYLAGHRRTILRAAAAAGLICLILTLFLRFDSNPLDLRSRKVESVSTLFDLMGNPNTSPNTINVTAPTLDKANALAQRLSKLPGVAQALTLSSFVPEDQDKKLALIADANSILDATLNPFDVKPAPGDGDLVQSFRLTASKLRGAAGNEDSPPAADARAFADALDALANGSASNRARANEATVPGLKTMLEQLSASLTPGPVTLAALPRTMQSDWVARDGTARIQVFPKNTSNDLDQLSGFSDQVLGVAPDATGPPISIRKVRTHHRARLHRGWNSVFFRHPIAVGGGAAPRRRCGDNAGAPASGRTADDGKLRGARPQAQLRQHHCFTAAFGHRRRLQYLFRGRLAGRREEFPAVEPDAGGDLFRRHHGFRLRNALAVAPSGHGQHGRAFDDFAVLDAGDDAAGEPGAFGAAAASSKDQGA